MSRIHTLRELVAHPIIEVTAGGLIIGAAVGAEALEQATGLEFTPNAISAGMFAVGFASMLVGGARINSQTD